MGGIIRGHGKAITRSFCSLQRHVCSAIALIWCFASCSVHPPSFKLEKAPADELAARKVVSVQDPSAYKCALDLSSLFDSYMHIGKWVKALTDTALSLLSWIARPTQENA